MIAGRSASEYHPRSRQNQSSGSTISIQRSGFGLSHSIRASLQPKLRSSSRDLKFRPTSHDGRMSLKSIMLYICKKEISQARAAVENGQLSRPAFALRVLEAGNVGFRLTRSPLLFDMVSRRRSVALECRKPCACVLRISMGSANFCELSIVGIA